MSNIVTVRFEGEIELPGDGNESATVTEAIVGLAKERGWRVPGVTAGVTHMRKDTP